jgi:hypothetical protein
MLELLEKMLSEESESYNPDRYYTIVEIIDLFKNNN